MVSIFIITFIVTPAMIARDGIAVLVVIALILTDNQFVVHLPVGRWTERKIIKMENIFLDEDELKKISNKTENCESSKMEEMEEFLKYYTSPNMCYRWDCPLIISIFT